MDGLGRRHQRVADFCHRSGIRSETRAHVYGAANVLSLGILRGEVQIYRRRNMLVRLPGAAIDGGDRVRQGLGEMFDREVQADGGVAAASAGRVKQVSRAAARAGEVKDRFW